MILYEKCNVISSKIKVKGKYIPPLELVLGQSRTDLDNKTQRKDSMDSSVAAIIPLCSIIE